MNPVRFLVLFVFDRVTDRKEFQGGLANVGILGNVGPLVNFSFETNACTKFKCFTTL